MQKLNSNIRFALIYCGLMVLIGLALFVLETSLGISTGSSGAAVALPFASGMMAGQYAAREFGDALPKGRLWRHA